MPKRIPNGCVSSYGCEVLLAPTYGDNYLDRTAKLIVEVGCISHETCKASAYAELAEIKVNFDENDFTRNPSRFLQSIVEWQPASV